MASIDTINIENNNVNILLIDTAPDEPKTGNNPDWLSYTFKTPVDRFNFIQSLESAARYRWPSFDTEREHPRHPFDESTTDDILVTSRGFKIENIHKDKDLIYRFDFKTMIAFVKALKRYIVLDEKESDSMNTYPIEDLIIHMNRSNITLEFVDAFEPRVKNSQFAFTFNASKEFESFVDELYELALIKWPVLEKKEAVSMASDYDEYYSKEHDNNGYMRIKDNAIVIDPPYGSTRELFKLNKAKTQSFLYDLFNHDMYE